MSYLAPSEFATKMVDAGESKIFMSTKDTVIRAYMAGATLALAAYMAVTINSQLGIPLVGAAFFPVGFIMLSDNADAPEYFLWRLMIADGYQHHGYGRRAVGQLIEYVRTRPNATELLVSYHPGEGGPRDFYLSLGFQDTGKIDDGEVVLRLPLE